MAKPEGQAWIELDRDALTDNVTFLLARAQPAGLLAVVKGNAYGHGVRAVVRVLMRKPIWGFGVAGLDEALMLRQIGIQKPILVLSYLLPSGKLQQAIRQGISLVVHDRFSLALAVRAARRAARTARIHCKIDTGTTRIGFAPKDALGALRAITRAKRLTLEGVFSHFADAESADQRFTALQEHRLRAVRDALHRRVPNARPLFHIACSAALLRRERDRMDLVRAGLALYGLWPSAATRRASGAPRALRPVLSWKTRIIQIKRVPRGTPIGYAQTFMAPRPLTIAVLPVGYADGVDRSRSGRGAVLVGGKRAPIRGNVCMNMTMVDVTGIPTVRVFDEVVLLGRQGRGVVTAEDVAQWSDTIPYETITRIHPSLPRILV